MPVHETREHFALADRDALVIGLTESGFERGDQLPLGGRNTAFAWASP